MDTHPSEVSPLDDRIEKDAHNRSVFSRAFPQEVADLHFAATELARFGGNLRPIDQPELALAGDLYRIVSTQERGWLLTVARKGRATRPGAYSERSANMTTRRSTLSTGTITLLAFALTSVAF